jgi:transcriptional regulator with XRE-family HTH domain
MAQTLDIKELRERVNWSQDRLAEFLGVDRSSVSHMENGRPPRGPVKRLLDMLSAAAEADTVDALFPSSAATGDTPINSLAAEVRA